MENVAERASGQSDYLREQATLRGLRRHLLGRRLARRKRLKDEDGTGKLSRQLEEKLVGTPARVVQIQVEGASFTRDRVFLRAASSELLIARTFGQVLDSLVQAHRDLKNLGCFKRVDALLDTYPEGQGGGGGCDLKVVFTVQEADNTFAQLRPDPADDEAGLKASAGIRNLLGFNECGQLFFRSSTRGAGSAGLSVRFPFSFSSDENVLLEKSLLSEIVASFAATTARSPFYWSPGLASSESGISMGLALFPSAAPGLSQSMDWKLSWREMSTPNQMGSTEPVLFKSQPLIGFRARETLGHSLKSALVHILTLDTRDDTVLPTSGAYLSLKQELAGIGGNVAFFKNQLTFSVHKLLSSEQTLLKSAGASTRPSKEDVRNCYSLSLSGAAGLLNPVKIGQYDTCISPIDTFRLGGPLLLRGFKFNRIYNCGPPPQGRDSAGSEGFRIVTPQLQPWTYLGGRAFWRLCAQVYGPMPYLNRRNTWISENLKVHAFLEAGSLGDPNSRTPCNAFSEEWASRMARVSCGVGMVMRWAPLGRVELNYCIPLRWQVGDAVQQGLQFGLGINFS